MRVFSARSLLVAASIALLIGGVTLYIREAVLDADAFADRAAHTLKNDDVRGIVSSRLVDQIIEQGSAELIQARPLLEAATGAALDTGAFQGVFEQAARNVNKLLFERDRGSIVLDLADAGIVVISALKAIAPKVADEVPTKVEGALIDLSDRQFATRALDVAGKVRFLGIALPILALLLFIASLVAAADRRRHVVEGGIAIAIVGGVVVIGLLVTKAIVLGSVEDSDARAAASSVWDSFFGDLRVLSLGVGALGLVFAATAASVIDPDEVEDWVARLRRLVTVRPQKPGRRLARAAAVIGLSLFVILNPTYAVQVVVVIAGAYGLYFGLGEVLQVIAPPRRGGLGSSDIDLDIDLPNYSPRALFVAGAVALGIAVTAVSIASEEEVAPPVGAPTGPITVCNGYAQLCGRPFNEVVLRGHPQLDVGRGRARLVLRRHRKDIGGAAATPGSARLLIDSHYGDPRRQGQRPHGPRARGHQPGEDRRRTSARRGSPRQSGSSGASVGD